jgi:hypothetical protein
MTTKPENYTEEIHVTIPIETDRFAPRLFTLKVAWRTPSRGRVLAERDYEIIVRPRGVCLAILQPAWRASRGMRSFCRLDADKSTGGPRCCAPLSGFYDALLSTWRFRQHPERLRGR